MVDKAKLPKAYEEKWGQRRSKMRKKGAYEAQNDVYRALKILIAPQK
jgi:hypothetical protein